MYTYQIDHFDVVSDLPLPCDPYGKVDPERSRRATLRVVYAPGNLCEFPQAKYMGRRFEGEVRTYDVGDGILLCVGTTLRMHIDREGQTVTVDVLTKDLKQAALYVIGAAMGFCTVLNGGLPLHASGVDLDGKRIGFLAPSGTGKSTTMWGMLAQGAQFVSDDLIPVFFEEGQALAVASASLYPKAGQELLTREGVDVTRLEEASERDGKFWFPLAPEQRSGGTLPLSALFLLNPRIARSGRDHDDRVDITRIPGATAISLLVGNTHAMITGSLVVDNKDLLGRYMALVRAVPVYTLSYEKRFDMLPRIVRALRETLGLPNSDILSGKPASLLPSPYFPDAAPQSALAG